MTPDERKAAVNAALRWSSSLYRYDSNEREAAAHILAFDAALTRAEAVVEAGQALRRFARLHGPLESFENQDDFEVLVGGLFAALAAHDAAGEEERT